jgi:hypothetical protein
MEKLDGACKHFISSKGIEITNVELLLAKQRMDATWAAYLQEKEFINSLPDDLLKYEIEYRRR